MEVTFKPMNKKNVNVGEKQKVPKQGAKVDFAYGCRKFSVGVVRDHGVGCIVKIIFFFFGFYFHLQ